MRHKAACGKLIGYLVINSSPPCDGRGSRGGWCVQHSRVSPSPNLSHQGRGTYNVAL